MGTLIKKILVGVGVGAGGAVGYNTFSNPTILIGAVVVAYYIFYKK